MTRATADREARIIFKDGNAAMNDSNRPYTFPPSAGAMDVTGRESYRNAKNRTRATAILQA